MTIIIEKTKKKDYKIEHIPLKYKKKITSFLKRNHIKIIEKEDNDDYRDVDDFIRSDEKLKEINASLTPEKTLKLYRKRDGLTRKELGAKLNGVLEQNIYNMETGRRPIGKGMAIKLAKVFDCSYKAFL